MARSQWWQEGPPKLSSRVTEKTERGEQVIYSKKVRVVLKYAHWPVRWSQWTEMMMKSVLTDLEERDFLTEVRTSGLAAGQQFLLCA